MPRRTMAIDACTGHELRQVIRRDSPRIEPSAGRDNLDEFIGRRHLRYLPPAPARGEATMGAFFRRQQLSNS